MKYTMFGFTARNFEYKTPGVMSFLYNSQVKTYQEYAINSGSVITIWT